MRCVDESCGDWQHVRPFEFVMLRGEGEGRPKVFVLVNWQRLMGRAAETGVP